MLFSHPNVHVFTILSNQTPQNWRLANTKQPIRVLRGTYTHTYINSTSCTLCFSTKQNYFTLGTALTSLTRRYDTTCVRGTLLLYKYYAYVYLHVLTCHQILSFDFSKGKTNAFPHSSSFLLEWKKLPTSALAASTLALLQGFESQLTPGQFNDSKHLTRRGFFHEQHCNIAKLQLVGLRAGGRRVAGAGNLATSIPRR